MNLIYLSQKFEYTPAPTKPMAVRAINWRYQLPGVGYTQMSGLPRTALQPRAVNWRYQLP